MPTTPFNTYKADGLIPFYPSQGPNTIPVRIKASQTIPQGTLLGEVTASPGVYAAYNNGASDGTQTARGILRYDVVTDASGSITNIGDLAPIGDVAMYIQGVFDCASLHGLDAPAIADLGGTLIEGDSSTGYLKF